MRNYVTGDRMIDYPVPQLVPGVRESAPAFVMRLQVRKPAGAEETEYAFLVMRDLKVHLKYFTVRYEYACADDSREGREQVSGELRYADGDINRSNVIVCRIAEARSVLTGGFRAWVSEAAVENGEILRFREEDFLPEAENARPVRYSFADDPVALRKHGEAKDKKKKKKPLSRLAHVLIALAAVLTGLAAACALVVAVFFGFHYTMYRYLIPEADALVVAGRQDLAEDYVNRYLSNNYFFRSYREETEGTVGELCGEGRYNEALAIAAGTPFCSLTERVCAEASDDALERGAWEEAYVYAAASPSPYEDEIAWKAAGRVLDGEENGEAYLTALKSDNPAVRDALAELLADRSRHAGQYAHMLAEAEFISDGEKRQSYSDWNAERLRKAELAAALALDDDAVTLAYLEDHAEEGDNASLIAEYRRRIYDAALARKDYPEVFRLAREYGYDTEALAHDFDVVRADPADAYFSLTAEEMRTYHAETVSASDIIVSVKNGTVSWAEGGRPKSVSGAVSVSAGNWVTSILKSDGTVTAFANQACGAEETPVSSFETGWITSAAGLTGVVAMASGERHTAYLKSDGTVAVLGDNTYGQADTGSWRNIIAVAAGRRFTAGLKSDGTLVACGSNAAGQCDVSAYRNAADIRAGYQSLVILFRDGTVAVAGDRSMGIAGAESLSGVVKIRAGLNTVVAELSDGSFRMCGGAAEGAVGGVSSWTDAVDFAVGDGFLVRQDSAGTVYSNGVNAPKNP